MNKILLSLAGSAAAGALTLVSPAGWSPRVRRAYVVVPGVLVGTGGALVLARASQGRAPVAPEAADEPSDATSAARCPPVVARLALPLALGAATSGMQAGSLWIDAVLEGWLVRRGAAHPRRWMAVLAVLASLGTDALGDRVRAPAVAGRHATR